MSAQRLQLRSGLAGATGSLLLLLSMIAVPLACARPPQDANRQDARDSARWTAFTRSFDALTDADRIVGKHFLRPMLVEGDRRGYQSRR